MKNNFIDKKLNTVIEELKEHNLVKNSLFSYVAGSIFEGFGNQKSDIDIFIIYDVNYNDLISKLRFSENDKNANLTINQNILTYNFFVKSYRIDCEIYSLFTIEKYIEKLNKIVTFQEDNLISGQLEYKMIDFLHRIKYGMPIRNAGIFNTYKSKIDYTKISYYQVVSCTEQISGLLEDIEGALQVNDNGTVFFMLRKLVYYVAFSFLATKGETNPSEKWLYLKFKRYAIENDDFEFFDKYLELQSIAFVDSNQESFCRETMDFYQKISLLTQKFIYESQKNT